MNSNIRIEFDDDSYEFYMKILTLDSQEYVHGPMMPAFSNGFPVRIRQNFYCTLSLALGDANRCLEAQNGKGILFPALMLAFTAIDLMAKIESGSSEVKGDSIGSRFDRFVEKYDRLKKYNANLLENSNNTSQRKGLLWQLRNAILHSFSTYIKFNYDNKQGNSSSFSGSVALVQEGPDIAYNGSQYYLNIKSFVNDALKTIPDMRENLLRITSEKRRNNIKDVIKNYGIISIGHSIV